MPFFLVDPLEISKSNSAMFRFQDQNAHIDTRRIFLELTYWATDENDAALTPDQYIGGTNVAGHCIMDTVSISIGETQLEDNPRFYPIISKLAYLQSYTEAAQKTFLPVFELNHYDIQEKLTDDISTCLNRQLNNNIAVFTAKNTQGKLALALTNKTKHTVLLQLMGPLQSLDNLIPAQVDLGIRIEFASGNL